MESTMSSKKLTKSKNSRRPSMVSGVEMSGMEDGRQLGAHDVTLLALLVEQMMDLLYKLYISHLKQKRPSQQADYDQCINGFKAFCEQIIFVLQDCYNLSQDWIALIDAALNDEPNPELLRFAEVLKGNIDSVLTGIDDARTIYTQFSSLLDPLVDQMSQTRSTPSIRANKNGTLSERYSKLNEDCGTSVQGLYQFWQDQNTELSGLLSQTHELPPNETIIAGRDYWSKYSHTISASIDSIRQSEDAITVAPAAARQEQPVIEPAGLRNRVFRISERLRLGAAHPDPNEFEMITGADLRPPTPPSLPITQTEDVETTTPSSLSPPSSDLSHSPTAVDYHDDSGFSYVVPVEPSGSPLQESDGEAMPGVTIAPLKGDDTETLYTKTNLMKKTARAVKRKLTLPFSKIDTAASPTSPRDESSKRRLQFIRRLFSGRVRAPRTSSGDLKKGTFEKTDGIECPKPPKTGRNLLRRTKSPEGNAKTNISATSGEYNPHEQVCPASPGKPSDFPFLSQHLMPQPNHMPFLAAKG